jgi:hypothetical protein
MAQAVLERMLEEPDGPGVLRDARQGLREDQWGEEYTDSIGQHGLLPSSSWPMEQLAAFAQVHALIYGGHVAQVVIGTRRGPLPDADREGNAATLADLPRPFRAEVDMQQSTASADGALTWDEPVRVMLATGLMHRGPDGSTCPVPVSFTVPPGRAVLEIGSSLPSRTWAHLIEEGGVARWPYGHDRIRLMVNLDPETLLGNRLSDLFDEVMSRRATA